MSETDPLLTFFSAEEAEDSDLLYTILEVAKSDGQDAIKKAYRRAALRYHPDKQQGKDKEGSSKKFQQIGFAYAVLSDAGKKKRYDATGRTDDMPFSDAEEMGWDAYFESVYTRVDRQILDDDKKAYQGSQDELDDLSEAYTQSKGSLPKLMSHVPHSQQPDEERFVVAINKLIEDGDLPLLEKWTKTSTDKAAREKRAKGAAKEAAEAEKMAQELGVHEEFFGTGKKGKRKSDASGPAEDGDGALKALIVKRQKQRSGGLDALAAKYAAMEAEAQAKRGKKGNSKKATDEDVAIDGPPDISDADFEALQAKMFAKKGGVKKSRKVEK